MYVCNCNGITEREVKTAVASGAWRWKDVHTYYGCEPCCGKCQCEIVEAIATHTDKCQIVTNEIFGQRSLALGT